MRSFKSYDFFHNLSDVRWAAVSRYISDWTQQDFCTLRLEELERSRNGELHNMPDSIHHWIAWRRAAERLPSRHTFFRDCLRVDTFSKEISIMLQGESDVLWTVRLSPEHTADTEGPVLLYRLDLDADRQNGVGIDYPSLDDPETPWMYQGEDSALLTTFALRYFLIYYGSNVRLVEDVSILRPTIIAEMGLPLCIDGYEFFVSDNILVTLKPNNNRVVRYSFSESNFARNVPQFLGPLDDD